MSNEHIKKVVEANQEAIEKLPDKAKKDAYERIDRAVERAKVKDKAQKAVERAVAEAAAKDIEEARIDKNAPARNTQEFIDKYYKRRFSASTAGKAYLLNFLFDVYQGNSEKISGSLWNLELIKEKIRTEEDMRTFDAYYHLTEWLRNLYENSRTMRNALRSVIADYYHITTSILAAENVRRCVINTPIISKLSTLKAEEFKEELRQNPDATLTLWLNTLTLEAYTPQAGGASLINSLRKNIKEGLRYMVAYHSFLDQIAEYTGIPECAFLKVKSEYIKEDLNSLNEALKLLREDVEKYREPEIEEYMKVRPKDYRIDEVREAPELINFPPASLTLWTPEYLRATMKYFQPVEDEPPIPDIQEDFLRDYIRREFKTGIINWYVLYTWYSIKYRMDTPPKGPETDTEEGE